MGAPQHLTNAASVIAVTSVSTIWRFTDDWIPVGITVVGDLNADGTLDAAVESQNPIDMSYRTQLVYGPLRSAKSLPADAVVTYDTWNLVAVGDGTGDGIVDLDFMNDENDRVLVAGPPDPLLTDIATAGIGHEFSLAELDGDGILDKWADGTDSGADTVAFTWGPSTRWSGPPDVTIAPQCPGLDENDWVSTSPKGWPDITGDGVREVWVGAYGQFTDCTRYLFPLPASGIWDPEQLADAHSGVAPWFEVVTDQTGDGLSDVWVGSGSHHILGAPVSVVDGVLDSAVEIPIDPQIVYERATGLDFDADGISDFLVLDAPVPLVEGDLEALPGPMLTGVAAGGTALEQFRFATLAGAVDTAWDLEGGMLAAGPFLESGFATVFVKVDQSLYAVDLGVASAVP